MTAQQVVEWNLPSHWYSFNAAEVADGSWRHRVPAADVGSAYERQLAGFETWVGGRTADRDGWLLVLNPEGYSAGVVAVGTLDVRPGPGIDDLLAVLERQPVPVEVVQRTLERIILAGDQALVCQEMSATDNGPLGAALVERGLVIRHVAEAGLDIAVDLRTVDLGGFEQIGASVAAAVAGIRLVEAEATS